MTAWKSVKIECGFYDSVPYLIVSIHSTYTKHQKSPRFACNLAPSSSLNSENPITQLARFLQFLTTALSLFYRLPFFQGEPAKHMA